MFFNRHMKLIQFMLATIAGKCMNECFLRCAHLGVLVNVDITDKVIVTKAVGTIEKHGFKLPQ